ncbi:hypothetical protein PMAYCL1PPCAC_26800, partial [Pristionchus mayeri]
CLFSPLLSSVPCGTHLPKASNRFQRFVIGGNNVTRVGKWPWQIRIFSHNWNGGKGMCGGTVISERWILTAGHCVRKKMEDGNIFEATIFEAAGAITRGLDPENPRIINVAQAFTFANYTPLESDNDIALLKIENPLIFDHSISPICLPKFTQSIPTDGYAVAIGFGISNYRGTNQTVMDFQLREVIMPIVRRAVCDQRWTEETSNTGTVNEKYAQEQSELHIICAGSMGHTLYRGDSGGPLMMKADDGRWFQVGVAAFVHEHHITDADVAPNAFMDIRPYCGWIKETTGGEASCQEEEVKLEDVQI